MYRSSFFFPGNYPCGGTVAADKEDRKSYFLRFSGGEGEKLGEWIGITTYYIAGASNRKNPRGLPEQDLLMSTMDYFRMIRQSGGFPVAIPVLQDEEYRKEILEKCSGFLFTGGADIHPYQYNHAVKKGLGLFVPQRDDFERKLLEGALKKKKPIFGICRGLHLINVFFGGTLHQDLSRSGLTQLEHLVSGGPKSSLIHRVSLLEGSRLHGIFNSQEIWVNSLHHQAVDGLGLGLQITARCEDGIVEAVEHQEYPLLAVQWHPEMMGDIHKEQQKLFHDFVQKCLLRGREKI